MNTKSLGVAITACLAASPLNAATPELPHVNGLLVLPNTRVVNAKQPLAPRAASTATSSARAFLDPVTGQVGIGEVTGAEAADLARIDRREGRKSASVATIRTSPDGNIVGARLDALIDDADIMPYSVARRTESGALQHVCVHGEKQAHAFLKAATKKEKNHAR
jgi:hypothetical protein